jgi:hypothetical protein
MSTLYPNIDYTTVCKLCGKKFVSTAFEAHIIGAPGQRVYEFVHALYNHIEKFHQPQSMQISGSVQQYVSYLVGQAFTITDPQLVAMAEAVRAALHHFSQKYTVTDEEILDRVAKIGLENPEHEEGINLLIRDLRDLLTESGRYAPKFEEKPLVSA